MRIIHPPTVNDMRSARDVVRQYLEPTPLITVGANRWLKLETSQPIGAFKVRGAIAALSTTPPSTRVVTASAGNHALGMAWAAKQLDREATIVVSENVSQRKLSLLQELGANVVQYGQDFDAAEAYALSLADDNCMYVSAYNDPHVIAGGGTVLDELLEQLEGDFSVIVPVGGGGLAAGIALRASQEQERRISVIGVEAANSMAVSAAMTAGSTVTVPVDDTLADGLAGNLEPGSITPNILRECGVRMLSVSEAEIATAMRKLHESHDIRAEGAAAVAYAALTREPWEGQVVALITGQNVTDEVLSRTLQQ